MFEYLTKKQRRIILQSLNRLFSTKAWVSPDAPINSGLRRLSHMIKLDEKRVWFLNDAGYEYSERIVSAITENDTYLKFATHSNVWNAFIGTLGTLLGEFKQPETAEEFLELMWKRILQQVDSYTFVAAIFGVILKDVDAFQIGNLRLVKRDAAVILEQGALDHDGLLAKAMEKMTTSNFCLVGTYEGTQEAAKRDAFQQFRLCAGLLAVSAASTFDGGAHGFRIGVATSPEESRVPVNVILSWNKTNAHIAYTHQWRRGQDYEITPTLLTQLQKAPVFATMISILQGSRDSALKQAIVRGVYWFADAHKDSTSVMRLVKFWSCIESFFSIDDNITQAVSVGTAVVLTYGPFHFVQRSNRLNIQKRLGSLYAKRSKAVHHAFHDHVNDRDLADLSQWAAWLLLSMGAMSSIYSTPKQILAKCFAIHEAEAA